METQAQAKQLWFHYTDENERTSPDILKTFLFRLTKVILLPCWGITALASQHLQNT